MQTQLRQVDFLVNVIYILQIKRVYLNIAKNSLEKSQYMFTTLTKLR